MNVLFVPCLSLDTSLLERLASSIDYPIQSKMAFNNGIDGALDKFADEHPDWIVVDSPFGNRGVADSWNECAKLFPEQPAWFICNEDCWFLPGYLETICKCSDDHLDQPIIFLNSSHAFYAFVWHSVGKNIIGDFDANLWPAYYEDCDYKIRLRAKGYNGFVYALQGLEPLPHGKPRTGGMNYNAMLQGCGLLNRYYWLRKWGNQDFHGQADYKTPYRDQRLTVDQWVWKPEERETRKRIWDAWMALPNPSIYE